MILKRSVMFLGVALSVAVVGVFGFGFNGSSLDQSELADNLARLRAADSAQCESLIDEIMESPISPRDIAEAMLGGVEFETTNARKQKLVAGWSEWTATDTQGVSRPYQIYLPKSVAEGAPVAATIVYMHGSVGRPEYGAGLGSLQAVGYAGFMWTEMAEEENFLVICPMGRKDCKWWTDNGVSHVDAVIRDACRSVDFPEDSIFAAGFSDGGSACYFRVMAAPDPFAGFIALNGNPTVASMGSLKQIYLPNMAMSKTFVAMTQQDFLYPTKMVLPHIQVALEHNADILTVSYPRMNHRPTYFEEQRAVILNFIKTTQRKQQDRIRWYAADAKIGKIGRLELLEFVDSQDALEFPDSNVLAVPNSVKLGIQLVESSNRVDKVSPGSVAETAGIQVDDELLTFDGQHIDGPETLLDILRYKLPNETFECAVRRSGKKHELIGRFPRINTIPVYRRQLPTGFAECQFVRDPSPKIVVKSRNVTRLRLWLPEDMSSLTRIQVDYNGETRWAPVTKLTSRELLTKFAAKGMTVPRAYIELKR